MDAKKKRLDVLMVEKGLAETRNQAQRLIMAGEVIVNDQTASKPGQVFEDACKITLKAKPPYVSRGGEKLQKALEAFSLLELNGKTCVDVGASTGGFSDCLLQHGAGRVYAVDVGYGQLHDKLRNDPRVVVMERTNARNLQPFPQEVDLVTVDASFISLKVLLPVIKTWKKAKPLEVIALVKPQFEAGRKQAAKGRGVIRDERIRQEIVSDILEFAQQQGYQQLGVVDSPLLGPKGNKEFLIHLQLT